MRTRALPSCLSMIRLPAVAAYFATPLAVFFACAVFAAGVAAPPAAEAKETLPQGSGLYAENCSSCHGPKGAGDGPTAAKLRAKPADLTASNMDVSAISTVVRNGKRECPSWRASLDAGEIAAVAAYAKSLQR